MSPYRQNTDRRQFLQSVGLVGVAGTWGQQSDLTQISSCTTIDTAGRYALADDIGGGNGPCLDITASDVVLDGRGYTVTATGQAPAVRVTADEVTVQNVGDLDGTPAMLLSGASRCLVRENGIGDLEDGIVLEDGDENRIVANDIDGPDFDCITLENADRNEVTGNSIDGEYGVRLVDCDENLVAANTLLENEQGIILAESDANTVRDNSVEAPLGTGIRVSSSAGNSLRCNSVTGGPEGFGADVAGIAILDSPNTDLRGSLSRDHAGKGIRLSNADGSRVVRNWARLNEVGISIEETDGCELRQNAACANDEAQIRIEDSTGIDRRENTVDCGEGRLLEVVPGRRDARYRIEVTGSIAPATVRGREPNPDDEIDGDTVTGRVFPGYDGDAFRFTGDIETLTLLAGDCRFFVDGAAVSPDETAG